MRLLIPDPPPPVLYRCCVCSCRQGHGLYAPPDQHDRPCRGKYCTEGRQATNRTETPRRM